MSMVINPFLFERPFLLLNNGFESGSLSPWANLVGTGSVTGTYFGGDQTIIPHDGSYMLSAIGGGGTVTFGQVIPIPSANWAQVDAGDAWLSNVSCYHNPGIAGFGNDTGRIFATFLDGGGSTISTAYSPTNTVASAWTLITLPVSLIPPNTRSIRIGAELVAEDGTHDNFVDDFSQPIIVDTFITDPAISTDSGFFAQGDTATVNFSHRGASTTYQWTRDGAPISGATSASYTYQAGDVGHVVTCTVTATTGSVSVSATAPGTTIGTPAYIEYSRLPAGDMQSGSDVRLPAGDMQSGSDVRVFRERTA
ncbi:hypothetical protein K7W03_14490 [Sphingobium sp. PNB]|uniref:hypothetical protein n=1 Tax=Sphingobium sp. PNB TaxID=863934 RepID=UPI001CA4624F|nr:hypothetical protein [Sphingobium sp. PNB]MCB4860800.1 hypothetical protein [Sphingobium sp. PNB]